MPLFRIFHTHVQADPSPNPSTLHAWGNALAGNIDDILNLGFYREVAIVDVPTIDDVFAATNHIEHRWQENASVVLSLLDARSTSVGDIVMNVAENSLHFCDTWGWRNLSPMQDHLFRAQLGSQISALPKVDQAQSRV